jgi:GntR family transcriptional regulator/MocR family aminotransferase
VDQERNTAKNRPIEQANIAGSATGSLRLPPLDRQIDTPLFRQLYERIRSAVLQGELRPGERLPPSRALAAQLPASRATVQAAYDMLAADGFITGKGAAGTVVAQLPAGHGAGTDCPVPVASRSFRHSAAPAGSPGPFQLGLPALDEFPRKLWSRLAARSARRLSATEMLFQPAGGYEPLRRAIANYLAVARGVACTAEQVLVTAGYQGALAVIAAALLRPGDRVWVEDPGYPRTRNALALLGAGIVAVPVDAEGLQVEAAVAQAPDARLALVTPSHQFPLGMMLSLNRRRALIEWARASGGWIVEDDYDSEYRYVGRPVPALHGLDAGGRVLYVGTFSKVLFPSLRLGYLVVPSTLVERFARARTLLDGHPPMQDQLTATDFIQEGHFTRHIGRMRRLYAARRQALADALDEMLPVAGRVELAAGGMHLVLRLRPGLHTAAMIERIDHYGLAARPLSTFAVEADPGQALLLGFTNLPTESARYQVSRLRDAVLSPAALGA